MAAKNILLLIADDLGKQLSCYDAPTIKTPHLDQLALDGTRFENAFASTASCSASRSVIYTGLHTHENGQYGLANNRHHFATFDHVETAPALLARHGYLTGVIGKVHVGPTSVYPWEVREESDSRDVAWVADRATTFFERARSEKRPFFLTVGFVDPHRDLTRAGFGNGGPFDERVRPAHYQAAEIEVPAFLNDQEGVRLELTEYYNAIDRLDQGVGMIRSALQRYPQLDEETLVIFLSDNGPPFINSKTTLYDAGIRLPLIVRHPKGTPEVVSPNFVSYVDILPTILDWAGHSPNIKNTDGTDNTDNPRRGRSLLPILSKSRLLPEWGWVFGSHTFHEVTNYWPTRFMRNRRYKYHRNIAWRLDFPLAADIYGSLTWEGIRNANTDPMMIGSRKLVDYFFRPPEELYDIQADPEEIHNLAPNPGCAKVLEEMRVALEAWQLQTKDPWLYRDGVSVLLTQHHLQAGLKVPDRWDFDAHDPANRGKHAFSFDSIAENVQKDEGDIDMSAYVPNTN